MKLIIGIDEVGRGSLAGSVIACAIAIPADTKIFGIRDSKKLSHDSRKKLEPSILSSCVGVGFGEATCSEIDSINVLEASLLAMERAFFNLGTFELDFITYIDGSRVPKKLGSIAYPVIRGDQIIPAISAASILAKIKRDEEMCRMHEKFPEYGFRFNKGYPTKNHRKALMQFGPCPLHRITFQLSSPSKRFRNG